MRSLTESSVVSTMKFLLRFRRTGYGQDLGRLLFCFQEQTLSRTSITIAIKESRILPEPAICQKNGVLLNRWTETPRVIANRGDVLLVCKGSGYGKTAICDIEEAHIARQIMAIKKLVTLEMDYIRLFLQANFDQIKSKGQGVIPGIDRNSVMHLLFPLPPLSEQRRIVEKQQELFDKITLM